MDSHETRLWGRLRMSSENRVRIRSLIDSVVSFPIMYGPRRCSIRESNATGREIADHQLTILGIRTSGVVCTSPVSGISVSTLSALTLTGQLRLAVRIPLGARHPRVSPHECRQRTSTSSAGSTFRIEEGDVKNPCSAGQTPVIRVVWSDRPQKEERESCLRHKRLLRGTSAGSGCAIRALRHE